MEKNIVNILITFFHLNAFSPLHLLKTMVEYIYNKNGHLDNTGFLDYRMPVCSDLPMLDTVLVEIPNPKHPQGVRGVGEVPLVPPLAAISNAVYQALGKRSYSLPMSPPKVLKIIEG